VVVAESGARAGMLDGRAPRRNGGPFGAAICRRVQMCTDRMMPESDPHVLKYEAVQSAWWWWVCGARAGMSDGRAPRGNGGPFGAAICRRVQMCTDRMMPETDPRLFKYEAVQSAWWWLRVARARGCRTDVRLGGTADRSERPSAAALCMRAWVDVTWGLPRGVWRDPTGGVQE